MKITCPNCQIAMQATEIKTVKKKGFHLDKQCPHCQGWFRLMPELLVLKTIGILCLLVASILNILTINSEFSTLFSLLGFIGILTALIITIKGKQQTINR